MGAKGLRVVPSTPAPVWSGGRLMVGCVGRGRIPAGCRIPIGDSLIPPSGVTPGVLGREDAQPCTCHLRSTGHCRTPRPHDPAHPQCCLCEVQEDTRHFQHVPIACLAGGILAGEVVMTTPGSGAKDLLETLVLAHPKS